MRRKGIDNNNSNFEQCNCDALLAKQAIWFKWANAFRDRVWCVEVCIHMLVSVCSKRGRVTHSSYASIYYARERTVNLVCDMRSIKQFAKYLYTWYTVQFMHRNAYTTEKVQHVEWTPGNTHTGTDIHIKSLDNDNHQHKLHDLSQSNFSTKQYGISTVFFFLLLFWFSSSSSSRTEIYKSFSITISIRLAFVFGVSNHLSKISVSGCSIVVSLPLLPMFVSCCRSYTYFTHSYSMSLHKTLYGARGLQSHCTFHSH